jgi:hypothetical protein
MNAELKRFIRLPIPAICAIEAFELGSDPIPGYGPALAAGSNDGGAHMAVRAQRSICGVSRRLSLSTPKG